MKSHTSPKRLFSTWFLPDDYGGADSATSFWLDASTALALLHRTFETLRDRRAPWVVQINKCATKYAQRQFEDIK